MAANRLKELDAFRGLAILLVVLFHYTYTFDVSRALGYITFPLPVWFGHLGVNLFFIISGFVIYMTLRKLNSVKAFAISRFSRLYPPYWVSVLLNLALFALVPSHYVGFSPLDWVLNLTMVQELIGSKNIDWVYWTLTTELIFYVTMALVLGFRKLDKIEYIGAAILLFRVLLTLFQAPFRGELGQYLGLTYFHLFFAGIIFYRMKYEGVRPWLHYPLLACCFILELAMNYKEAASGIACLQLPMQLAAALLFANTTLFFGLFLRFVHRRQDLARETLLSRLGVISYSLYLVHNNLGSALLFFLLRLGIPPILNVFLTMGLTLTLAAAFYRYVETPSTAWVKHRLQPARRQKEAQLTN